MPAFPVYSSPIIGARVEMVHFKKKIFKDTKYKETYMFYHNALATMTDKDCINWMREEGLLERWILPQLGLNEVIEVEDEHGNKKISKRYNGRPVGDCTEVMPLDNSLFRDLRTSFDTHVALSYWLDLNDKRRFSKCTPLSIHDSICRIWDPIHGVSPKPSRIIQDVDRVLENLFIVCEADGAVVPGICDRNGHRNKAKVGRQYWGRNVHKKAMTLDEMGIHPDMCSVVRELWDDQYKLFSEKFGGVELNFEE